MRTSTVAFCRSAVGTIVMTLRRNLPVGIGVEHRRDRLAGRHAVDVALVDVDFDLERAHVDDRADAGAREAAAGRHRRDHLARLRVLRDRHAAERRADDRVVEVGLLQRDLALGDVDLLAQRGDARDRASRPRPAPGRRRPRSRGRPCSSCVAPAEREPRLGEPDFVLGHRARAPLRACASASASAARSVESSSRASTWPSRTAMPSSTFTSIDLAGDLRRDGGAAPRRDVARGVQHRRLRAGRRAR